MKYIIASYMSDMIALDFLQENLFPMLVQVFLLSRGNNEI